MVAANSSGNKPARYIEDINGMDCEYLLYGEMSSADRIFGLLTFFAKHHRILTNQDLVNLTGMKRAALKRSLDRMVKQGRVIRDNGKVKLRVREAGELEPEDHKRDLQWRTLTAICLAEGIGVPVLGSSRRAGKERAVSDKLLFRLPYEYVEILNDLGAFTSDGIGFWAYQAPKLIKECVPAKGLAQFHKWNEDVNPVDTICTMIAVAIIDHHEDPAKEPVRNPNGLFRHLLKTYGSATYVDPNGVERKNDSSAHISLERLGQLLGHPPVWQSLEKLKAARKAAEAKQIKEALEDL